MSAVELPDVKIARALRAAADAPLPSSPTHFSWVTDDGRTGGMQMPDTQLYWPRLAVKQAAEDLLAALDDPSQGVEGLSFEQLEVLAGLPVREGTDQ